MSSSPNGGLNRSVSRLIARASDTLLPERTVSQLRERREWHTWVDSLGADTLADLSGAAMQIKRELFARHVALVEVETHARCNRVCSFCPNSIVDRRRNRVVTDVDLLRRVFAELGAIGYARQIKVARYSEPLTNPHLHERIADARRLAPQAQLTVVTNTDYLSRAVVDQLLGAGLNILYMSIYLKAGEQWSLPLAQRYTGQLGEKLGLKAVSQKATAVSLICLYEYRGLLLRSACMDFDRYGTDRGGAVAQYMNETRLGPCREPFETFVIDYTGAVMPCCNLRSDIPEQVSCAVGDLSHPAASIFDVYAGALSSWRRSMVTFGAKAAPCTTCRHRDVHPDLAKSVARRLDGRLRSLNHLAGSVQSR